jgi:addiction module RelE/StbE family toxin
LESKSIFEIRYLKTAECDLYNIVDYVGQDNPEAAETLLEKIDFTISHLASNPYMGVVPRDTRLKEKGYRMLVVGKYLVFYVVKEETNIIQIRRVIHGTRKYDFLL